MGVAHPVRSCLDLPLSTCTVLTSCPQAQNMISIKCVDSENMPENAQNSYCNQQISDAILTASGSQN